MVLTCSFRDKRIMKPFACIYIQFEFQKLQIYIKIMYIYRQSHHTCSQSIIYNSLLTSVCIYTNPTINNYTIIVKHGFFLKALDDRLSLCNKISREMELMGDSRSIYIDHVRSIDVLQLYIFYDI